MKSGIASWVLEDEFLLDSPVIGFFGTSHSEYYQNNLPVSQPSGNVGLTV